MHFTRREFAKTAAVGFVATQMDPAPVKLTALFAAQLPASIQVPASVIKPDSQIYERRVYAAPIPLRVFAKYGIRPTLIEGTTYLFPFVNLEARQKAWDRLNGDPEWQKSRRGASLNELAFYEN